jgi:hypothetical protein
LSPPVNFDISALGEIRRFLLRIADSNEHQILEHLDVRAAYDRRIDPHARNLSLAVRFDRDHFRHPTVAVTLMPSRLVRIFFEAALLLLTPARESS